MIKKYFHLGLALILLMGMFSFAMPASASTPQNFTVWVGSDNANLGVSIMAFFPQNVSLHVGDSVTWKANSHEIHTVTFLDGESLQPLLIDAPQGMDSPLQFNPVAFFPAVPTNGLYDGSSFVNSGLMSTDSGLVQTFKLTFTQEGVYDYVCYVHGEMMSGTISVVGPDVKVPLPYQEQNQARSELKADWMNVPSVLTQAYAQIVAPTENPDGTYTHTIIMGYESGNIDVMRFFPSQVTAQPGDTLLWEMSSTNMAPHTVTFFNGTSDQSLVMVEQGPNGLVALINPAVLFPSDAVIAGTPLNNTDYFNSGIMIPGLQNSFSLTVGNFTGNLNYECILHDTSGMSASLTVHP